MKLESNERLDSPNILYHVTDSLYAKQALNSST